MKVHPVPKKRNITVSVTTSPSCRGQKKLRRLPHIFPKVLELPFCSDADVDIQETVDFLKFTVFDTDMGSDVVADAVEIYPGVTKLVVRRSNSVDADVVAMTGLEIDLWRFRLPECTRPELATATYDGGDLVVVVPKDDVEERELVWGESNLVLVQ
ncbi:uncharacterized protein LOC130798507 [Amaranthus tricolor]|uniref:uncharacterized protein LOC130798507 n=1 Tax=Amaranthus tricolor TaxID=29722 RepID=UPI00258A0728|nr:uncharacterized protein LOC130798507 [Amaranthus tricolor]